MVCKLADYGEVALGKQALWALLEYVRSQVGEDVQQRIDKLRSLSDSFGVLPSSAATDTTSIDILVQKVRDRLHDRIQRLHGTIQLLNVAYPVEIDRLYVDVNILEEPSNYVPLEIDNLLKNHDHRRDFDRFGLSERRERVSGLQAVTKHSKLMVLGKPGAGKTTFLQHVVLECNNKNLRLFG
jgi:predicted NACHT family NTPase